jgi:hypothetical protein
MAFLPTAGAATNTTAVAGLPSGVPCYQMMMHPYPCDELQYNPQPVHAQVPSLKKLLPTSIQPSPATPVPALRQPGGPHMLSYVPYTVPASYSAPKPMEDSSSASVVLGPSSYSKKIGASSASREDSIRFGNRRPMPPEPAMLEQRGVIPTTGPRREAFVSLESGMPSEKIGSGSLSPASWNDAFGESEEFWTTIAPRLYYNQWDQPAPAYSAVASAEPPRSSPVYMQQGAPLYSFPGNFDDPSKSENGNIRNTVPASYSVPKPMEDSSSATAVQGPSSCSKKIGAPSASREDSNRFGNRRPMPPEPAMLEQRGMIPTTGPRREAFVSLESGTPSEKSGRFHSRHNSGTLPPRLFE